MIKKALALSPLKSKFGPLFFSGNIEHGIKAAKDLGYDGVEISVNDPDKVDKVLIKNYLDKTGLKVVTVATGQAYVQDGLFFCSSDDEVRRLTVERVKKQLEFAAYIESSCLTVGGIRGKTDRNPIDEALVAKISEAVFECCEFADKLGIKILIEAVNHYEVSFLHTIGQSLDFIKKLNHRALGLLYDTYHSNMEEASIAEPLLTAGDLLLHVHFADNNRLAPGYGCFNFTEVIRVLNKINYNGYICIEALPLPDSFTAASQASVYLNAVMNGGNII